MIINTLCSNKVKILADKTDFENAGISPENLISNSKEALSQIEHLLKSKNSLSVNLPEKLFLKDYFICTYNFKVFSIILFLD